MLATTRSSPFYLNYGCYSNLYNELRNGRKANKALALQDDIVRLYKIARQHISQRQTKITEKFARKGEIGP